MNKFSWKNINSKVKLISASIIILMLVQMLVLIIVSNNRRVEQFSNQAAETLSNNIVSMDETINYMKETAVSFSLQRDVYYMLFSKNITREDMQRFRHAVELLSPNIFTAPDAIYVYNEINSALYTNGMQKLDVSLLPQANVKDIILSGSSSDHNMKVFFDSGLLSSHSPAAEQMIRICYFPSKQSKSCLILDVNFSNIIEIFDMYKKNFSSEIFVASKNGLSYGTGTSKLSHAFESDMEYLNKQSFNYPVFRTYNNTKYLVLKKTSENSDFAVFSLIPHDAISANYGEAKVLFSLNVSLIVLAFLAFALFFMFKTFNQAITENAHFKLLHSEEQAQKQFAKKKQCLINCLVNPEDQDIHIAEEYLLTLLQKKPRHSVSHVENMNVAVLRIELNNFRQFRSCYSAQDVTLYRYGVMNICEEILNTYVNAICIYEKNEELVFLVFATEETVEKCRFALEECRKAVKNYISLELSGFLSDVDSLNKLPELNNQTLTLSEYQFTLGNPCFITSDFIRAETKISSHNAMAWLTPIFNADDKETRARELDKLFAKLNDMRPEDAKNALWIFMFRLYNVGIRNMEKPYPIEALVSRFNEIPTLSKMRSFFEELCSSVFSGSTKSGFSPQDYTVVTVQAIIERSFREPDFCSDVIAEEMNSSKAYLARKYKNLTGISISEEIIARRLKAFAHALVTTNENVKTIIASIGGTNYNYYMSLFKKQYSMTPTEYRRAFKDK